MTSTPRRMAILGAGPVGIEAALAFAQDGFDVQVYEAGDVANAVRQWGHVRLFSPWELNVSARGLAALQEMNIPAPEHGTFLTGQEFVEGYLAPLASHESLQGRIHTQTRIIGVGRESVLKGELIASPQRKEHPFRILVEDIEGDERIEYADVVLDTTGTYGTPNALGDSGIPAPGERKAREQGQILHTIPDVNGMDKGLIEGKNIVVVGAGYSAITVIRDLQESQAASSVTWLTRSEALPYDRIEGDPLPQRDELAALGNKIVETGDAQIKHLGGISVRGVEHALNETLTLKLQKGDDTLAIENVDLVLAMVGYRPNNALTQELQIHTCYASEGPMKLAAALLAASGGGGDCLAQSSPGPDTLKSPEPDFFVLGAKSYGRGSSFLMKLGLEQIEDVKTLLSS